MKPTLLFDCDGVLYPLSELPTRNIVTAMKETARTDLHLSGEEQKLISAQTISEKKLGMFNYIHAMCAYKNYDFDTFCRQMVERTDYSRINANLQLYNLLKQAAKQYHVGILTNNSRAHVEAVAQRVFKADASQLRNAGIEILDVTRTEKDGIFWRKQKEGLELICRKYGYIPAQTTLFDDAPDNLTAAREIGMNGVLINAENSLPQALKSYILPSRTKGKTYE